MTFSTFGINHHHAGVAWRECLAVPPEHVQSRIHVLLKQASEEVLLLSTCNRTEIYCVHAQHDCILRTFLELQGLDEHHELTSAVYQLGHAATVRHIFRVACGLDSMVLGETQILGQLKEAFRMAQEAHGLGQHLHLLVQHAFHVAKDIRHRTALSSHVVSIPSVAANLAGRVFPSWHDVRVLLVGAGMMNHSFGRTLSAMRPRNISIANRSLARAEHLLQELNTIYPCHGQLYALEQLPDILANFDMIVCCTSSPMPLIQREMVNLSSAQRSNQPSVFLDLGVPRNIAPEIGALEHVRLYSIDDLAILAQHGQEQRRDVAQDAEQLVEEHVLSFLNLFYHRQQQHVQLKHFHQRGQNVRQHTLAQAQKKLAQGQPSGEVLQWLSHTLTQRLLHEPSEWLKQSRPISDHPS